MNNKKHKKPTPHIGTERWFKSAQFLGGWTHIEQLPEPSLQEVCILGRSNVGKSSLINRLAQSRHLARTSATPGRTQQINYFECKVRSGSGEESLYLCDLPGFGFSKLPRGQRNELVQLNVDYITHRETLKLVCLLNDCRREPEDDEFAIRDLAFNNDRRFVVVATKADKFPYGQRMRQVQRLAKAYGLEESDLLVSGEGISIDPIWARIVLALM